MAKAIYSLKMFLFKEQFQRKSDDVDGLREICIFIIRFYGKRWLDAPSAIKAPNQDLTLLQNLIKYREINARVSQAASSKLLGHLWYISEDLAALSFFDDTVLNDVKLKMVHAVKEREGAAIVRKRVHIKNDDRETLLQKDISDYVTKKSLFLFRQYNLPYDFLAVSPESWTTNTAYNKCMKILEKLTVVNDTAEREVALAEDFNLLLTKDEDQRQYLLQAVKFHMKLYPTCQKEKLASLFTTIKKRLKKYILLESVTKRREKVKK